MMFDTVQYFTTGEHYLKHNAKPCLQIKLPWSPIRAAIVSLLHVHIDSAYNLTLAKVSCGLSAAIIFLLL